VTALICYRLFIKMIRPRMKPKPHILSECFDNNIRPSLVVMCADAFLWFDPWVILLPVKLSCTHTHCQVY
jgi:hypothetical protein